jgi:small subunit ribosomal protein S9
MAETKKYNATGRRKRAIAKVVLTKGKGKITVNSKDVTEYFNQETLIMDLKQPLDFTETNSEFDVSAEVKGGGNAGQAGAIRLGIARALMLSNIEFRKVLKEKGMITRDARVKERKKYGLKKARKAPQFSKR